MASLEDLERGDLVGAEVSGLVGEGVGRGVVLLLFCDLDDFDDVGRVVRTEAVVGEAVAAFRA